MTEADWHRSNDAGAMLDYLWEWRGVSPDGIGLRFGGDVQESDAAGGADDRFGLSLHRFYLASCRGIWPLLPQEASRRGVELAEQFLAGEATAEQVSEYNWHTEGAAFVLDYNTAPEDIARWVAEVQALPPAELRGLLHPPETADEVEPRELLKRAAYFADYVMVYPSLRPQGPPPDSYRPFLSAQVLRRHVRYPGAAGK
ncbi:hypothetical protein GobsT_43990 [Gemmata obscuriglobus]|uniref:Uncharacterized protein n=1 Tax=Gemmata obscuriglobus TaxID=114 RepID=A0A2Z3GY84_9BACT|nr:hypothetical protein [Gemmata obscuriglobus]AWM37611.1 hypothetical protein C1280_11770 [Gemmata obscuriglobus]QEG29601.1 hypothetical protein GobsT_43990 [Gemmata obscuriglobus]VTS08883.1 Uncultured bacterium genome assembly Metasoil_fosmids_resub OS=uncultured bacterium PE=4 SV=1 [Gemmata obscuriglobus UQM 2246]